MHEAAPKELYSAAAKSNMRVLFEIVVQQEHGIRVRKEFKLIRLSEETAKKEAIADVPAIPDENEQKEIQAIDRALARIELGEYGACEVCGKGIEAARLGTIPRTSVCSTHARTK